MTIDWRALAAPFPPEAVSWRVGSTTRDKNKGMALAFLDARDVMNRLDAVLGPAGWQCRYSHADDKKTVCDIGVKVGGEWVWKADGAGETDIEAEKGSLSSAFKRSAVRWGIGRYLYDLPSPWVELDDGKRIKESEQPKLRALLAKDAKAHETPAAATSPPAQTAPDTTNAKGWDYVGLDGVVGKELTGGRWMDRMEGDLKRLNGPKTKVHWEANERVARRIVESVNDALRSTVQARFDRLTDLVSENISPVSA